MGIGRLLQCLLANFARLRQVLILALDFSSGPPTNFKGALAFREPLIPKDAAVLAARGR